VRGDGAFVFSGLHVDDTSAQVQTALSRVVKGVGGLSHASWRSFVNDRKTADAHGFIDGDLIEAFLDLPPRKKEEVVPRTHHAQQRRIPPPTHTHTRTHTLASLACSRTPGLALSMLWVSCLQMCSCERASLALSACALVSGELTSPHRA